MAQYALYILISNNIFVPNSVKNERENQRSLGHDGL